MDRSLLVVWFLVIVVFVVAWFDRPVAKDDALLRRELLDGLSGKKVDWVNEGKSFVIFFEDGSRIEVMGVSRVEAKIIAGLD